ncbi:aldehyde dehydrogenase family protein [Erysipelothrix aquatica]|uniref:aldehyde dehydrogenase family protein n=1 Tax=Erysipelothrix aquatica TaxID=2683714 RepID=UPI00135CA00D|nr:aldehyde dehydrogenase family protein [Erysipelothrix aquatica]
MDIIERQRHYYKEGHTLNPTWRKEQLRRLKDAIKDYEPSLYIAFEKDLGKHAQEVYLTEIAIVYREIDHMLKYLHKYQRPKRVRTPWILVGRNSKIYHHPRGNVLIISPFNYPFQLAMMPLVGAIAGGNTAIIKTSELTPHVSSVLKDMITSIYDPAFVCVIEGDVHVNQELLKASYDLIFFTGSPRVGKIVMECASKHLTPVVLELGGKSPAIVFEDANLRLAAQRIAYGKFVNTGQTCIAPDYVLVHENTKEKFVLYIKEEILKLYGPNPRENPDYGRIVSESHAHRLQQMINTEKNNILHGGMYDGRYIEPTLIDNEIYDDEIFGPILPIKSFQTKTEVIATVNMHPNPLAVYVFTKTHQAIIDELSFGGGMINDTLLHITNEALPFGGVRTSGIGNYHGKYSFETFTHQKAIMKSGSFPLTMMMPPYTKWYHKYIRKFF